MILSFHPCFDTDVQIILGDKSLDTDNLECIRKSDAIILPQACTQDLYEICATSNAHVFPNYEARIKYPGKLGQSLLFEGLDLPHPETLRWQCIQDFKEAYPDGRISPHDFPFFIKKDKSHEAEGVFLVKDRASLIEVLDFLALQERADVKGFITQDFISCGGNVLRAVIMGKQIITYWKRPNKPGQEITTISQGAIIDHDWRPDLQKKAMAQAEVLTQKTGINLAAIDFVFPMAEKNPGPLFLEINYYFGRRGLGGTENYYRLLFSAIQAWLREIGLDPESIRLI